MIRYALRCSAGHHFDAWFRSSEVFETMREAARIACTTCGATSVEKAPMAPSVAAGRAAAPAVPQQAKGARHDAAARALARLREHVETHSDYVGRRFVSEARAMHEGRLPQRSIHGEARIDEARKLIEDGIPVAPLPFTPKQKMN